MPADEAPSPAHGYAVLIVLCDSYAGVYPASHGVLVQPPTGQYDYSPQNL
jgi:hypothetical protein